ncbi:histidine kinase dimerization/phosphoacceptor domain -containing protein [Leptodesmis sichuanensis]|uniref:histidine kinase dimerization/phosphoacceptor domain -containing protein n=1 Tax=Leptodesmis sichuanensis TaxID=2906798 RepID=UPI001F15E66E|nr:histidine kinase dimerization/phosphoacceptor domain -containing protein [Leptodesmis sichuanensis]UIE39608.1 GAF domain-containing protein [Leptodesmis sichuanensis A121]
MEQQNLLVSEFSLELAIDSRPLTVRPDTALQAAIEIMGNAQSSCVAPGLELSLHPNLQRQARAQVLLVIDDRDRLLGVFGEQEALQAIAAGVDLMRTTVADIAQQPAIVLTYSPEVTLFTALARLRQHQIHHLPVVSTEGTVVGLITTAGIRAALQVDDLLKSRPVSEVAKDPVVQAPQTTSILTLAGLMAERQVNQVVLTQTNADQETTAVGIISARNIILLNSLGLDLAKLPATAILNPVLPCFSASESVLAAYWYMQQQQVQHFIVTSPTGEWLGLGTPTSFLYTLDLPAIADVAIAVEQSIEAFATDGDRFTPPSLVTAESSSLNLEELQEQLACSRLLERMALHIRESLQLNTILQTAVDEVRQFLKTERVLIYRFNPDWSGRVVVEAVGEGWQPALGSTTQDTCFGQNYAQAYKEGRTLVADDIYTAGFSQCHIDILVLFDVRASLVVPILQGNHLWGLLCAYHCSEPRHWRSFEVELLKQLATHMAIAIQQSELYQQLQNELAERKKAEAQLKISLREKESLLKEIHHRVKNNLQVISSVLRLQSDYVKDAQVLELFKDSQNRIRSMALIHEKLYQSSDLSRINLSEYLTELTGNLMRSYTSGAVPIRLKITSGDVWLNIDTAIPCGLIINELVSNSLKHAFPRPQETNEIEIEIQQTDAEQFTLTVRDNGIGFPETLDFRNTESLGLELVCIFTEQLGGRIELDRSNGTAFTLTFSEMSDTGRE